MAESFFTLQTYTPNSDVAVGFKPNQLIYSRAGNDTLLGYQPLTPNLNQAQIDFFIGDLAVEDPAFRSWSDTFILGDWSQPYYANGDPDAPLGVNDFGLVIDFNSGQDFVQLFGTANDYQLVDLGIGSALLKQQQTGLDVVGFLLGSSNLNLGGNYFQFRGSTPPPGPVLPQAKQLGTPGFDVTAVTATDTSGNVYVAGGTTGSLEGANNGESRDPVIVKYDSNGNQLQTIQFGSANFDTIYGIKVDTQGNIYVGGTTEGNLGGPKQAEGADAFVAKFDSNGNQQWIQQFGRELINSAFSLDIDEDSNVYLSGITVRSSPDFVTDDFWVTKYDTNGSRQWFTEFGSPAFDEPYAVAVSNDGSVYAGGWTLGDFGGTNAGLYDAALAKLDNDGNVEWTKQFGTADFDWIWGVDTDTEGNVYAGGWTLGDLAAESAGSYDPFLAKYDSDRNQLWIKQFGSAGDDQTFRLNIDNDDNIFLTGYTNGNLGGTNAGSFDAWVSRFDTDGNQVWIQQYGTPEFDQGYGISTDNAGNLYATGITQDSFGGTNAGSFDGWVAKIDKTSGNLQNFNGTPQSVNPFPSLNLFASNVGSPRITGQQIDYLTNFFEEFLSSTGIGTDGSGLANLIRNPYVIEPTPVPEASSGVGLLMFAAVSCVGAMLRGRKISPSKSRISIE